MKTKQEIVKIGCLLYQKVEGFYQIYIIGKFPKIVEIFADHFNVPIIGLDSNMPNASANGITIINFGMGRPMQPLSWIG